MLSLHFNGYLMHVVAGMMGQAESSLASFSYWLFVYGSYTTKADFSIDVFSGFYTGRLLHECMVLPVCPEPDEERVRLSG